MAAEQACANRLTPEPLSHVASGRTSAPKLTGNPRDLRIHQSRVSGSNRRPADYKGFPTHDHGLARTRNRRSARRLDSGERMRMATDTRACAMDAPWKHAALSANEADTPAREHRSVAKMPAERASASRSTAASNSRECRHQVGASITGISTAMRGCQPAARRSAGTAVARRCRRRTPHWGPAQALPTRSRTERARCPQAVGGRSR